MSPMKPTNVCIRTLFYIFIVIVAFSLVSACTTLTGKEKSSNQNKQQSADGDSDPTTIYYDFDDVVVPRELKVRRDKTFIYESAGLKAGLLSLKGRVDTSSLIDFFEINMKKDNWRLVSLIKTPATLMLYHKNNRLCVIEIDEDNYSTYTRIWLAPVSSSLSSGLLK
jgi:hypothetical protein